MVVGSLFGLSPMEVRQVQVYEVRVPLLHVFNVVTQHSAKIDGKRVTIGSLQASHDGTSSQFISSSIAPMDGCSCFV